MRKLQTEPTLAMPAGYPLVVLNAQTVVGGREYRRRTAHVVDAIDDHH